MALKTNFTDDILAESMNGKRQYNITENSNGTKSLEDVTDYQSVGSTFSAKNMNETNAAVNQAYDDIGDEFNPEVDYAVGDYTIRNNKIWKFTTAHPAGAWDESHVKATKILSEARELTENLNNYFIGMDSTKLLVTVTRGYQEYYTTCDQDCIAIVSITGCTAGHKMNIEQATIAQAYSANDTTYCHNYFIPLKKGQQFYVAGNIEVKFYGVLR